jgi:hypothetical protein
MHPIRKILVAVKNPDRRGHAVIDKAIRFARDVGASIEFFHAIAEPVFLEVQPLTVLNLSFTDWGDAHAGVKRSLCNGTLHIRWQHPPGDRPCP